MGWIYQPNVLSIQRTQGDVYSMSRTKNKRRELTAEEVALADYLEIQTLSDSPHWIDLNEKLKTIKAALRDGAIDIETYREMLLYLRSQEN